MGVSAPGVEGMKRPGTVQARGQDGGEGAVLSRAPARA